MVLKVWDRAGNDYETAQDVRYAPNPPEILINVEKVEKHLRLSLDREDKEIPLAFWFVEVWNEKGDLLKASDGQELPFVYEIPIPDEHEFSQIEGVIALKDILGNQSRVVISDLYLMALQKEEPQDEETTEVREFKHDSWSWVPNF